MDIFNINWKLLLKPKVLLLGNLGLKQTIFKNTFWLALAEGLSKLLKFFLFVYIARILGVDEYGKFSFALAFVSLFLIFSNLGIFKIITREFAKNKENEKDFPAILSLKTLLSLATFSIVFIGSFFITASPLIRVIIWILGIQVLLNSLSMFIYAFFRARQKMEYQAWGQMFQVTIVVILCFFVLFSSPSAKNLSVGYLIGELIALAAVLLFFHFKISPLKLRINTAVWKKYLIMSYPLALVSILGTINSHFDSTIMGALGQISQTGWYSAALKIVLASFIPIGLIGMTLFPVLSKSYGDKMKESFKKTADYYSRIIVYLTIPIVVGGMILAPKIIDLIYDQSYFPSILAFQILIVGFGFINLALPLSHCLIVSDQQKKVFWASFFSTAINVLLNIILIPRYSLYGASFATLFAFLITLYLYVRYAVKYTSINIFNMKLLKSSIISIISASIMYIVISQVNNLHVLWIVLIGSITYFICLLLFKIIQKYAINKNYAGK